MWRWQGKGRVTWTARSGVTVPGEQHYLELLSHEPAHGVYLDTSFLIELPLPPSESNVTIFKNVLLHWNFRGHQASPTIFKLRKVRGLSVTSEGLSRDTLLLQQLIPP